MRLTLIILSLLAIGQAAISIDLLPEDAALSRPITLDLKGESMSDIAKVLSRTTGLRVRASADVADQKATVLVDNMPARDVMNGLATLYGWSWAVKSENDEDVYIIYDPLKKKREADRQEALDKAKKALAAQLDSLSFDGNSEADFHKKLAMMQYRALSPKVKEAFLSGVKICLDSDSPMPDWQPSKEVMDTFLSFAPSPPSLPPGTTKYRVTRDGGLEQVDSSEAEDQDTTPPNRIVIELSSVVGTDAITVYAKVKSGNTTEESPSIPGTTGTMKRTVWRTSMKSEIRSNPDGTTQTMTTGSPAQKIEICSQEINYPLDTLEYVLPAKPADGLLVKKVSVNTSEAAAAGAIIDEETCDCFTTRTDLLAALHDKLGLQVISDYYSSWGSFQDVQDITVKQLIEEKLFPGLPADWGWDGKVLFTRVKDIRAADSREIPNRLLRPWQTVVKRQGYRGIGELAEAALLSDEQRQAISEDCHRLRLGECKELDDVFGNDSSSAFLRFYGLLTHKQKTDIFAGEVGVMELTDNQRSALTALINSRGMELRPGVYTNDGINLNMPDVVCNSFGVKAVVVRMTGSGGSYVYNKSSSVMDGARQIPGSISYQLDATTAEGAVAEARQRFGKDIDPQNVICLNRSSYTLTVYYEGYDDEATNRALAQFPELSTKANQQSFRLNIKIPEKKS